MTDREKIAKQLYTESRDVCLKNGSLKKAVSFSKLPKRYKLRWLSLTDIVLKREIEARIDEAKKYWCVCPECDAAHIAEQRIAELEKQLKEIYR